LMEKEIEQLSKLQDSPERPYVAVIGGAKLDTKIPILNSLLGKADKILIGGAMAYTFLKAKGISVGDSKVETDKVAMAKKILDNAKKAGTEIMLPVDHIAAKEFSKDAAPVIVDTQHIPDGLVAMDIGERTMDDFQNVIENAKTIMWNGPMGVFEFEQFSRGTEAIGEYIGLSAPKSTFKVAGGGDTITAMEKLKINFKNYNHISTGGGAMLDFLSGEDFLTLEPLKK
jgi:phosphoglycerate kinase